MAHNWHMHCFQWPERERETSAAEPLNETFLKCMHKLEAEYSPLLPLIQNKWDIWQEYLGLTLTMCLCLEQCSSKAMLMHIAYLYLYTQGIELYY